MIIQKDLFGQEIIANPLLRDTFIEPPFSVLDTKSGNWQRRKRLWKAIGMRSEVGRDAKTFNMGMDANAKNGWKKEDKLGSGVSIFDPALCEVIYKWFCPDGGLIIDPFAGGSVRGIVANYLGYKYTGIDIRQEQVDSNREQGLEILDVNNQPQWYVGDSNNVLAELTPQYDFMFSCPPYADLEVYSQLEGDISNMNYKDFMTAYESIISRGCKLLKKGSLACFVVGEVRDKDGYYLEFVPDTIKAFRKAGMRLYNEAILLNTIGTACMRAGGNMKSNKLVKIHQNVLVFKKP